MMLLPDIGIILERGDEDKPTGGVGVVRTFVNSIVIQH